MNLKKFIAAAMAITILCGGQTAFASYPSGIHFSANAALDVPIVECGTCGDKLIWEIDGLDNMTIRGIGEMEYYGTLSDGAPWSTIVTRDKDGGKHIYSHSRSIRKLTIEDGVTSISDSAFKKCSFESISIPGSVTSIGSSAFSFAKCSELTLPESVERIDDSAFYCFSGKLTILNPNCDIHYRNTDVFGEYDTIDEDVIIVGYKGSTAEAYAKEYGNRFIDIEATPEPIVTTTAEKAEITEPVLGTFSNSSIKWSFDEESATLTISGEGEWSLGFDPLSINSIPWKKYDDGYGDRIEHIVIEEGVTVISHDAFSELKNLTSISIAEGVTIIGTSAFSNCSKLKNVKLPSTLTEIGNSAFKGCTSLEEINIPDGVAIIWGHAFEDCTSLKKVTMPTAFKANDNSRYIFSIDYYEVNHDRIPNTALGFQSFSNTAIENISIPENVLWVSQNAFSGCKSLKSVSLSDSVESIDPYAFKDSGLVSVEIPDSVVKIDQEAFSECIALESVTILNPECEIADDSATICNAISTVRVPAEGELISQTERRYYGVIRGYDKSTAQAYASRYGYKFESLGEYSSPVTTTEATTTTITTSTTTSTTTKKPTTTSTTTTTDTTTTTTTKKPTTTSTTSTTSTTTTSTTTTSTTTKKPATTTDTTTTTTETETTTTTSTTTKKTASSTETTTTTSKATATDTTSTTTSTTTQPPAEEPALGDVNGDDIINAVDASRILVLYANINSGDVEVTEQDMAVCDINKDGMLNAVDASLVLAYYADLALKPELTLETFLEERK